MAEMDKMCQISRVRGNATSLATWRMFLRDVDVYLFDAFGTTVDWFTTIKRIVAHNSNGTVLIYPAAGGVLTH